MHPCNPNARAPQSYPTLPALPRDYSPLNAEQQSPPEQQISNSFSNLSLSLSHDLPHTQPPSRQPASHLPYNPFSSSNLTAAAHPLVSPLSHPNQISNQNQNYHLHLHHQVHPHNPQFAQPPYHPLANNSSSSNNNGPTTIATPILNPINMDRKNNENINTNESITPAPDDTACLTDSDIAARALAASGLNVAAPEFVPSFAVAPASPPPSPQHAASPSAVYANVADRLPPLAHSPASSSLADHSASWRDHLDPDAEALYATYNPVDAHPDLSPAALAACAVAAADDDPYDAAAPYVADDDTPSPEAAVSHFEEHFPALSGAQQRADAQRALGWRALQDEQAAKARDAEVARRLNALRAGLSEAADVEAAATLGYFGSAGDDPATMAAAAAAAGGAAPFSADIGAMWVSTGRSVGALYESLRAEAAEQARVRNRYFDRATAAFKKGDGATARKLGALGREANAKMKELHRKAADAIFEVRNPPGVNDVVDLHGLHVAEAIERLPDALEKAARGKVRILTGTGHHTKGTGRARLRPAVKKWLQESGYFFEEVIDANEYVGSFIVERQ